MNVEKTEYIVFDQHSENDFTLVNDIHINECKVVKYLGLMVGHKLFFSEDIDCLKKKVSKQINDMYKSKIILPLQHRKMFANAVVLPVFDYLDIIYCRACKGKRSYQDILLCKKIANIALDIMNVL